MTTDTLILIVLAALTIWLLALSVALYHLLKNQSDTDKKLEQIRITPTQNWSYVR